MDKPIYRRINQFINGQTNLSMDKSIYQWINQFLQLHKFVNLILKNQLAILPFTNTI